MNRDANPLLVAVIAAAAVLVAAIVVFLTDDDPVPVSPASGARLPLPDRDASQPARSAARTTPPHPPKAVSRATITAPPVRDVEPDANVAPVTGPGGAVPWPWNALANCESGGNWAINTGNGYYGGLQFSLTSWRAVGGTGYPHEATVTEQIKRGRLLQAVQGWGAWPTCSQIVGLP